MMPQHSLPPENSELQELRHRYNRLCARFANVSVADPLAASDTVEELQSLSDQIVAMEMQDEKLAEEAQRVESIGPHALNRVVDGRGDASGTTGPAVAAAPAAPSSIAEVVLLRRESSKDRDHDARPHPAPERSRDQGWGYTLPIAERPAPRQDTGLTASEKEAEEGLAIDFDRLYRAIKAQEAQIATVLQRCEEHQRQLETMERRVAEHYPVKLLAAQLEALGTNLDHQRQRVTSLAIAIQRLLHWLAAERQRGGR